MFIYAMALLHDGRTIDDEIEDDDEQEEQREDEKE